MIRLLNFLSLVLSVAAFGSVIWIIVPAPFYNFWLFAVAASEWSLWLGALALLGIICSLSARVFYREGVFWIVPLIIGIGAFIISLYPFFSVLSLARENKVDLSFSQYLDGLRNAENSSEKENKDYATYTFVQTDGKDLQLDVYLPTVNTTNNGASVIVVHGGSWSAGARNEFPQWNEWLAAQGYTVFDVDYRIAPQPNYLTAVADVKCAVHWVKNHAAQFNVSPNRIAVLGRSAGAHLALLAAYSANDKRLPATCSENETDGTVRAVVSFYAPVDLLWSYDNPANQRVINGPKTLENFLGGTPHESDEMRERFVLASPDTHVSADTPPTLLVHGGQDQLVRNENMRRLADKLKTANAAHQTLFIPYAQHGFDYNFNGFGAQISKSVMLDFLSENIKGEQ